MKAVIIGSGLGGLSCGAILAKCGYEVTVLEKEAVIGGCLQCFERRGKRFETGMHFIGSASKGQTLHTLMRFLEISEQVQLSPLDSHAYEVISLDGKRYNFAMGRHAFIEKMAAYFPHQKDNLSKYYDVVERVAKASSLHTMTDVAAPEVLTEFQLRSINEVIESVITDPVLQQVLVGNLPLYAGKKDKTPFSTHAFIMDFYNQSAYRIVGGSDKIAEALKATIQRYGGEICTRAKVTKVVCDDQMVKKVEINGEKEMPVDVLISDIHPQSFFPLVDSKLIRPAFRKRIQEMENTVSAFTIYVDFKENTVPYMNYNFYGYHGCSPWDCESYDESNWPRGYLYMHLCHKDKARYASTGEIISYMWMKDVEQWLGTRIGFRGDSYENFKREKAEQLIDTVERDFPGFRSTIRHYYTSTPLTYMDYTGTADGSMYGIAKDINKGITSRVSFKTRIPNLYLVGQNVNSHGMLGVLVGTIVTCSDVLKPVSLFDLIKEAGL